jgi:hypothetical protein
MILVVWIDPEAPTDKYHAKQDSSAAESLNPALNIRIALPAPGSLQNAFIIMAFGVNPAPVIATAPPPEPDAREPEITLDTVRLAFLTAWLSVVGSEAGRTGIESNV